MKKWICGLVRRPVLSVVLVGMLGLAGSAFIGWLYGIPAPKIHDEFSYLLAADTFAKSRLTNPTHPMWEHFESFHIIHEPSYMSKYLPAQALFMALGQVLGGHPIVGVWLLTGLMCAAICWMLQAWVPRRWALYGGLLSIVHPSIGIGGYWAQSYWGGAVAAIGGALVLGGARRVVQCQRWRDAALLGAGFVFLANSRPYEGLLFGLPLTVGFFCWMHGKTKPDRITAVTRIVVPVLMLLLITICLIGYYNWRVTGRPCHLPYQIHEQSYAIAPNFLWQRASAEPAYRHSVIRDFHVNYALALYNEQRNLDDWFTKKIKIIGELAGQLFTVFAILLIRVVPRLRLSTFRNSWLILFLSTYLLFTLGLSAETFAALHYAAPIVGLSFLCIVSGARTWYGFDGKFGRTVCRFVPCLAAASSLFFGLVTYLDRGSMWQYQRSSLVENLTKRGGYHLVLVNYGQNHSFHEEWVYNEADLDRANIIWARTMGKERDCKLLNYFHKRHLWSLKVEGQSLRPMLQPYQQNICE